MCGVTPATIIRWIDAGLLKSHRTPGRHRRIYEEDLTAFWKGVNPDDGKSLRILVIDDETFIVDFFREAIEKIDPDINVQGAFNGYEAGEMVHVFKPHIVFLDLIMKGIDGFEVCRRIKNSPETSSINVIAITGYPSENNVDEIKSCGASEVLEKPIKVADIRMALAKFLVNASDRA